MKEFEELGPNRPLVLFDIDGTLTQGFTILSFAEYLAKAGSMDQTTWQAMQTDFAIYSASGRKDNDYRTFAVNLVDHYAQGLKGQAVSDTIRKAEDFFEEAKNGRISGYNISDFSGELVEIMSKFGRSVAVSGSPTEALTPLIRHLGITELRATKLEVVDGIFTGNVLINMALDTSKEEVVRELGIRGFDRKRSFAFGDSSHDAPLLEAVDNPFIVGDNAELIERGKRLNWPVLSSPQDVIPSVRSRIATIFGEQKV